MLHSKLLTKAKAKIDTPAKWTQGAYSRDAQGNPLEGKCGNPVCYCSTGAIMAVTESDRFGRETSFLNAAILQMEPEKRTQTIPIFNDTHDHAEVMAMFDRAIELAKEAEKAEGHHA